VAAFKTLKRFVKMNLSELA